MNSNQVETLYDYKDRLTWIQRLGWSNDELQKVTLSREQTPDEPFLSLPLEDLAERENIRGLYVLKSQIPREKWEQLNIAVSRSEPSGERKEGMLRGERESVEFRPENNRRAS